MSLKKLEKVYYATIRKFPRISKYAKTSCFPRHGSSNSDILSFTFYIGDDIWMSLELHQLVSGLATNPFPSTEL